MGCGCESGAFCKAPGRRVRRVTPAQQAEAAMRVVFGGCSRGTWVIPGRKYGTPRVRWLGLTWVGIPWPVRAILPDHGVNGSVLEGCGCIAGLKLRWIRLKRWAR